MELGRVAQLCVFGQGGTSPARVQCQSGGLATICPRLVELLPGLCPKQARCRELLALKLSAMEIALSDPSFRFLRTESLTHCAVTRAAFHFGLWKGSDWFVGLQMVCCGSDWFVKFGLVCARG